MDRDFQAVFGPSWSVRTSEAVLAAVYQYEVRPGITLQPNIQFIKHPGGGTTDPLSAVRGIALKDAAVLGLRTVVKF
ncbi:carbohydrate porin [Bradyrhizobium genosp. L]|uniref:carbohydrate porin n=1 Tax=Bradyrhizobium genosp. L TaxID=83637 RepID=UPI0018A26150|nr:carbohydrate porin [Bradyrhizobium genosp. L]QPF88331.1 carbohydrate porin [Bradyrhizobium genosp. L]